MSIESLVSEIVEGKTTIKAALEAAATKQSDHILSKYIGKSVFVRAVTFHYTGNVVCVADGFLTLTHAAWIADSGRFSTALANGDLNEVEPYPDTVDIGIGAIVDISYWKHALPRKAK
jgi:hypothetical protein